MIEVDVLRRGSPPEILMVPFATGTLNFSPFSGVDTFFLH